MNVVVVVVCCVCWICMLMSCSVIVRCWLNGWCGIWRCLYEVCVFSGIVGIGGVVVVFGYCVVDLVCMY